MIDAATVAVVRDPALEGYPGPADAFSPDEAFPEYPFGARAISRSPNPVYRLVRRALAELGLDRERFGSPAWNPLGEWIRPGERVLLKPNLVLERNLLGPDADRDSLVTHGSVVRAVLDYALIALGGGGALRVGDAPLQQCRFDEVVRLAGLDRVAEFYRERAGIDLGPEDFRLLVTEREGDLQVVRRAERREAGDRFVEVDMGGASELAPVEGAAESFRVTCYDPREMALHHGGGRHRYLVARAVLEADVVIGMPKLKTHRKAGITGSLKNLVGINGHKDRLPHHRAGAAGEGADAYERSSLLKRLGERALDRFNVTKSPALQTALGLASRVLVNAGKRLANDPTFEGSWHGNDTIWRTVLDLNRILLYADAEGRLSDAPCRRHVGIADAIVAGEGEGPLEPTRKPAGIVTAGASAAALDFVHASLMGFDPRAMPTIANAFGSGARPIAAFAPESVTALFEGRAHSPEALAESIGLRFEPPSGWRGHVESGGREPARA